MVGIEGGNNDDISNGLLPEDTWSTNVVQLTGKGDVRICVLHQQFIPK
jgi:hypothetical protein